MNETGRDAGPAHSIVIIQTAFLGDVVLSTPVIRRLRERFPRARIAYVAAPRGANVLETNPHLDSLLIYDKYGLDRGIAGFLRLAWMLRRSRHTAAVVLHRSLRSAFLAYAAGIPARIGFSNSAGSFLFTRGVEYDSTMHEIERNLAIAGELGAGAAGIPPEVFPTEEDEGAVRRFYAAAGITGENGIVGVAPGSAWATKRWPELHYEALIRRIRGEQGKSVVLLGGPGDAALCGRLQASAGGMVYNAAGEFTPRQSVAAMKSMDVLITNDNGAAHLALAAGIRVAAIFGPTVPSLGFAPYGPGHAVIELELACRPCGRHGGESCPLGHFKCMKDLSVERVYSAALPLMNGGRGERTGMD